MEALLLRLLTELQAIGRNHEELYDSEVREAMGVAIMEGFVRCISGYQIPADLGMMTENDNKSVRDALVRYINDANLRAAELCLASFHARLAAFQNRYVRVVPSSAKDYEELFGHTPPDWYDLDGNVIWDRVS
ncbi:MAG: hypothetical protein K8T25_08505 [Planctomycetia bacterium]|nr:hypothetical protein [Planctomycetia bacterium]